MPNGTHVGGGFDPLVLVYTLIVFGAPLLLPALIERLTASRRRPSDSEDEEGGGGGPRRPPTPPANPSPGGVPLDDAQPARVRLRDGRRLSERLPARPRRQPPEPVRQPGHAPARRAPMTGSGADRAR
jgi:hypothetical protein